jgi:high-affinity nickel-transport protein
VPINPFDDDKANLKAKVRLTFGFLIAANIVVWIMAWMAFADHPALLGTAFLAYMFGIRHAFDADHIAAIDNVVRKLMGEGKAPYSVGFFFSLGHSSIVILASLIIAITANAMQGPLAEFREVGSVIGTSVSAFFLLLIGIANLLIFKGIWQAFTKARRGKPIVEEDLDTLLAGRGLLARVFRRLFGVVSRSWHMYPIGFLFGLGFDTATEIGVLGISAAQATSGMSYWTIMIFPALFTVGMSLMDTADSALMTRAYGWAYVKPMRKLWYNLTITAASVVAAVFIGGVEAIGLIGEKLDLSGGLWAVAAHLNDNLANFGYAVVGIFIASWAISTAIYKAKGYDEMQVERI